MVYSKEERAAYDREYQHRPDVKERRRVRDQGIYAAQIIERCLQDRSHVPCELYIMTYVGETGQYKVGRTNDMSHRKKLLNKGHLHNVEIIALYKGAGFLEPLTHHNLEDYKIQSKNTREWFEVDLDTTHEAIVDAAKNFPDFTLPFSAVEPEPAQEVRHLPASLPRKIINRAIKTCQKTNTLPLRIYA